MRLALLAVEQLTSTHKEAAGLCPVLIANLVEDKSIQTHQLEVLSECLQRLILTPDQ